MKTRSRRYLPPVTALQSGLLTLMRRKIRPMAAPAITRAPFLRDRYTWLAYGMLAYFAYLQAALGPVMPFLRAELGLNFTLAGLHISAMATGMIFAGLTGAAVAARLGRPTVFWGGGGGMAAGALLLIVGASPVVTIGGALIMGVFGTYLLNMIPATLADLHGANRATAVTEANVAASLASALPPIVIGLLAGTAITWRGAFWLGVVAWAATLLLARRIALPAPVLTISRAASGALPRRFWLVWAMIVLLVAAEWSVVAWSADFMAGPIGLDRALASGLMTAFFGAMVIGRFIGSRLTRRMDTATLLPLVLVLGISGFLLFWLARTPALNVIGLFAAGLGVANLFPLSLAWATTIAGDQTDRASALISLAAGLAILIAPQTLGAAADAIGLARAMGLVAILQLAAGGVMIAARRER